jgi:hypothetical protein
MKFANRYKSSALGCAGCEPTYDCDPAPPPVFTAERPAGFDPSIYKVGLHTMQPQLRGLGGLRDYSAGKKAAVGFLIFGGAAYALARYTKPGKTLGKPLPAGLLGAALGAALGPLIY